MLLKFGAYSFPLGQVNVSPVRMVALRDESNRPYQYDWTIDISGMLLTDTATVSEANSPAWLSIRDLALRGYASLVGQDLILFDDLGRPTSVNFQNNNGNMIGPVQCVSLVYPDGGSGEYVTKRTFQATFTVSYQTPQRYGTWISYRESVQVLGTGGPRILWQEAINGDPVPVRVVPSTTITVIVSGQCVGYEIEPQIPPPHPSIPIVFLQPDPNSLSLSSPRWMGNAAHRNREFPASWSYLYRGLVRDLNPKNIFPRPWPIGR